MVGRITSARSHLSPHWLRLAVWRAAEDLADVFARLEAEAAEAEVADRAGEVLAYRPDFVSCVFHVGFLSVPETAGHLDRLRTERPVFSNAPARSAFLRSLQRRDLEPIDATAARVAGLRRT